MKLKQELRALLHEVNIRVKLRLIQSQNHLVKENRNALP